MRRVLALVAFWTLTLGTTAIAPAQVAISQRAGPFATYQAPDGWARSEQSSATIFTAPEGDATIGVATVQAADARAAVLKAWEIVSRTGPPTIRAIAARPARNGWDEVQAVDYALDPGQSRFVQTLALRKGSAWTVLLIDGTLATIQKRGAVMALVMQTLRAPGYVPETFAGRTPNRLDPARVAALRRFITDSMAKLDIPGAGLALYDNGRVVFEGGLGRRRIGSPTPVDAHTRFMIASNTKQMTTMLLARLVDDGKLRWDEPVTDAYPAFRLGDAETTAKVQIRHLICACTGVPRKDFETALATRRDTPAMQTFVLLADTQPTSKFGEVFQYSNTMAAAAGYVAAHIAYPGIEIGAAYDRAMRERIFAPIGMVDTSFDYDAVLRGNHATPHGWSFAGPQAAGDPGMEYAVRPGRPAGGAWSSAHDMIRYAAVELNEGHLADGSYLVSRSNVLARRARSVDLAEASHYGMGLIVDRSSGTTVVHHGGSLPGFMSDMIELPEAGVAAVLLTNSDSGGLLLQPFLRRLLEIVYDGVPQAEADVASAAIKDKADRTAQHATLTVPVPDDVRAKLAAHYISPALGDIHVSNGARGLIFDFGLWRSQVAARKLPDGTFAFVPIDPLALPFSFLTSERAGKTVLILRDGQHDYVYTPVG